MKAAKDKPDFLSDWFVSRIDHSTQDPNVGFVETLYQTCSAALIYLWKSQFRSNPSTLHKRTLQRDVESLRLWAENFPSEHLDEILGESSDLKINVLENLTGIGKILVPYFVDCETRKGRRKEKNLTTTLTQELETQLEKAMLTLSAEERSDSSSDDEISDDSSSPTERQENRLGRLHCYISCLVDLAPVIEKNVSCLYRKVETQPLPTENMFRLSHEAQPYAMRIRDRFVNAPIHLIERLAEANWERSIRIRAQQEEGEGLLAVRDAQTFFKPYSIFHDSGIGSSIPTVSQYAATVASHTSFLSIAGEDAHGRPRVPPLSQEYTRPFECDYCGRTVSMRNRIEWKMHVFADLQSYLCTHEDCRDALKTFPTRKLWVDHEFNEHFTRQQWRCFTCGTTTSTQQSFVVHLTNDHNIVLTGHRLTAAIAEAQETDLTPEFMNHKCALCSQSGWQTKKAYATHVGQHLEEISLACLPRDEGDSSDDASDTDTSSATTQIYVVRPDRSENHDIDPSSEVQNIQSSDPLPRTYPARGRQVSPYVDPPPVDLSDNLRRYRRIVPKKNVSISRPLAASASLPMSSDATAINDQVNEPVSPVAHDIQTSTIDNTAILHEPAATSSTSKRPTSYWSVDEQQIFPQLLAQFGLDFEGIANSMKRKTPQMVRNYYQRLEKRKFEDRIADMEIEKARRSPDFLHESEDDFTGPFHPADESIYTRASNVYHPHNRDQQTSSSSMRGYQQRSVQPPTIGSEAQPSLAPIGQDYIDPSKLREGGLSVKEWYAIHDPSKPVPVEPRLDLGNQEEALLYRNSGQQQHQHSGYQRQLPATGVSVGDSVLISFLAPEVPEINYDPTPQAPASGSRLSFSKDDKEPMSSFEPTTPPEYTNPSSSVLDR